jgi:transposase-like protein
MAKGQGKVASNKSGIVAALPRACTDEMAAFELFEKLRWGNEPSCPHCGLVDVYQMKDRATGERNKRFLWRCNGCKKQFTVRAKSVFEDSAIPMRHWAYAFWAACASKKGVSSKQIERMTGLTYKSALFMMHRVRFAMADIAPLQEKLTGIIEADESYVGGREKNKPLSQRNPRNLGGKGKVPVFSIVQRGGDVRSFVMDKVSLHNLRSALLQNVTVDSRLMTDSLNLYGFVSKPFRSHDTVDHTAEEYVRRGKDGLLISTNTVESVFSLLKRGVYGTFHSVSKKHLHRYLAEFDFRYNHRRIDGGERTAIAVRKSFGKHLAYRNPVQVVVAQ